MQSFHTSELFMTLVKTLEALEPRLSSFVFVKLPRTKGALDITLIPFFR
jgi:hypothetical protein